MDGIVLKRFDFPAYCIKVLENSTVAISGGGGTSKVGVPNAIELGIIDCGNVGVGEGSVTSVIPNGHHAKKNDDFFSQSNAAPVTQFDTLNSYEPSDAVMKIVDFTLDRQYQTTAANGGESSNSRRTKSDIYIAAPLNNCVEFLKLKPNVVRVSSFSSSTNNVLGRKASRKRTESNRQNDMSSSNTAADLRHRTATNNLDNNNNAGGRRPQFSNSSNGSTSLSTSDDANTTIKAISEFELLFRLDNTKNKIELANANHNNEDVFVAGESSSSRKNSTTSAIVKEPDESINVLAVCKINKITKVNNKKQKDSLILSVGSSHGSITIWKLTIDGDDSQKIEHEKLHVYQNAHGNKMVDELQVNQSTWYKLESSSTLNNSQNDASAATKRQKKLTPDLDICPHLLSIGSDGKCAIWSLCSKFRLLIELDYLSFFAAKKNKNLRMRHARYDLSGKCMYTTYIPKTRGSSRDLASYLQRWSVKIIKIKAAADPTNADSGMNNNVSINGWFQFDLNETHVCQYKVERTHRVRNTILTAIQSSNDGMQVCVGDYEGHVTLFDSDFNVLKKFKRCHSSVVTDLAFYHDSLDLSDSNKLILTVGIDRTLQSYKYIDNNKLRKKVPDVLANFCDNHKYYQTIQDSLKLVKNDFSIIENVNCMSTENLKYFCLTMLFILSFCYFFTYFE